MTVAVSFISISRLIPPASGPASNCGRLSRLTRTHVTCCMIAMASLATISHARSGTWKSRKFFRHPVARAACLCGARYRDDSPRVPRLSDRLRGSIASSESAFVFLLPSRVENASVAEQGRPRPRPVHPAKWETSLPFRRLAGCTTDTNDGPPELYTGSITPPQGSAWERLALGGHSEPIQPPVGRRIHFHKPKLARRRRAILPGTRFPTGTIFSTHGFTTRPVSAANP
jgi:hypothetical protein